MEVHQGDGPSVWTKEVEHVRIRSIGSVLRLVRGTGAEIELEPTRGMIDHGFERARFRNRGLAPGTISKAFGPRNAAKAPSLMLSIAQGGASSLTGGDAVVAVLTATASNNLLKAAYT